MLGKYWVPSREDLVLELKKKLLDKAMYQNYDIIIDNMNLNPKEVKFYEDLVYTYNNQMKGPHDDAIHFNYEIEFKDFWTPLKECIRRDSMRANPIGKDVITKTWNRYKQYITSEISKTNYNKLLKYDYKLEDCVIVDIDGTLSFNTIGRPWFGEGAVTGMLMDQPNLFLMNLLMTLKEHGILIIILTGRENSLEIANATKEWLDKYDFIYDRLIMRKCGDYRSGPEVKKELYRTYLEGDYNVLGVFEDDEECVKMYRDLGLFTLQPN